MVADSNWPETSEDVYWTCPHCGWQTLTQHLPLAEALALRVVCAACTIRGRPVDCEPMLEVYSTVEDQR